MPFILVLNSGSSSLKYSVFHKDEMRQMLRGSIEEIGSRSSSSFTHKVFRQGSEEPFKKHGSCSVENYQQALELAVHLLEGKEGPHGTTGLKSKDICCVGHRVVHGGDDFLDPVVITEEVIEKLKGLGKLAPLHVPANIAGIEAAQRHFQGVTQVAVFDTNFHQSMPDRARLYAVPWKWYSDYGIRKYGAHGISHQYLAGQAALVMARKIEDLKIITVHLGRGCSVCAVKGGRSIDTSMGLTPLEGLVMGGRCGDIDPSVVFQLPMEPKEIEWALNHESGLLGLCGESDMRKVVKKKEEGDQRSVLAFDMFCYRAAKYIGAYFVALGGLDCLVFSGGIGEHRPEVRAAICSHLECLGVLIDPERNKTLQEDTAEPFHQRGSKVAVMVIPTDEEYSIAKQAAHLIPK